MRVLKVEIQNFRGLQNIELDANKDVNVIVGPNAVGKTSILEACRLAKALLAPRYFQETQQTLISLGAISPHFQFFGTNQIDYAALAGDVSKPMRISLDILISPGERDFLKSNVSALAMMMLQSQHARNDEQAQFAMAQLLSSPTGQSQLQQAQTEIGNGLDRLSKMPQLRLELIFDLTTRSHRGTDLFSQIAFSALEQQLPAHATLVSYFPPDRAFPAGEVNVQLGSVDAGNQVQSYMGQPATKYQRLKQTLIQGLITNQISRDWINNEFNTILTGLLPGKQFHGLAVSPIGQLRILISDSSTNRAFDIDYMSSGEKGVILTFLLIRHSMAQGGILLIDEPELHLNPAVCQKLLPFLVDQCLAPKSIQALICTHSPEILGSAFDRDDSNLFHLRSGTDLTKVYRTDQAEMFEALRRLGASTADVLFSRGNIFVEGDHDAELLSEGFFDVVAGYKITVLGGRTEVEKEISNLQNSEKRSELKKVNLFIFDLDNVPSTLASSAFVRVKQWDRYCLENFLLDEKILFDIIAPHSKRPPESRGVFAQELKELGLSQLNDVVIRDVYASFTPENPGLRPQEVYGNDFSAAASKLVARLAKIRMQTQALVENDWVNDFVARCQSRRNSLTEEWNTDWRKKSNGKKLIQDLYRKYEIKMDQLTFKKRVIRQMQAEQSEGWRVVESVMRTALA